MSIFAKCCRPGLVLTEKVYLISATKQKPINSKKPVYFLSTKKMESKFLCSLLYIRGLLYLCKDIKT